MALRPLGLALALLALSAAPPAAGQGANPWSSILPTRVLVVEDGAVAFQAAVIVDIRQPLANPLFQRYPTRYILASTNECTFPVWIEATWRVPGKKPFLSFGQLPAGRFGEFFVETKEIAWDTPVPVGVAVYGDKDKHRKLGGRDVVLRFSTEDRPQFTKQAEDTNSMKSKVGATTGHGADLPLLAGFQEMDLKKAIAGTKADAKLRESIELLLWKNQSRKHWDCTHEVLGVQAHDAAKTAGWERLPADTKQRLEADLARGAATFEAWQVKSCDSVDTYLVALTSTPGGGTDVLAVQLEEAAAP